MKTSENTISISQEMINNTWQRTDKDYENLSKTRQIEQILRK